MEAHSRQQDLQELLRSHPVEPIDSDISSEEDNVEELSDVETEEEAQDIAEQPPESEGFGEETAHASMRPTRSLARHFMYGINHFKWAVTPPRRIGQRAADQASNYIPEALDAAKDKHTPMEVWSLLFTDEMLSMIVKHTNAEIARKRQRFESNQTFSSDIDLEELKAFIGTLYFCGLQKDNYSNVRKLWGRLASPFYRAAMPRARFELLLQCLRFDEEDTRRERRRRDKLAPIRDIWDLFISNCAKYYSPSKHVTIGEQLLSFGGKCAFRVHARSKLGKRGLNIVMMNDTGTYYMINAIPHVGKVDTTPSESAPSYYVRTLSEPIHNSHRNIICSNRFTSVSLVHNMKINFSLSMIGTITKNKEEVPQEMKQFTAIDDVRFLYTNNTTLLSYCPKKDKIVLILSSLHEHEHVDVATKRSIIPFYNSTKAVTDTFHQMCREYSTARVCNRWPMRFLFGMLDQGGINSFILYALVEANSKMARYEFLETLAVNLITSFVKRRLHAITIPRQLRMLMENVIGVEETSESHSHDLTDYKLEKRVRCRFCTVHRDRKTPIVCPRCRRPRCEEHRSLLCEYCAPINN